MRSKPLTNKDKPKTVVSLHKEMEEQFTLHMESPKGAKLMALADQLRLKGIKLDAVAKPPWEIYGEDAEQWLTKFTEDANRIGEFFKGDTKNVKLNSGVVTCLQGLFGLIAWLTIKQDAMKVMGLSQHVKLKAIQAESNSNHHRLEQHRRDRLEQGE
jgi:hypothetical protein